MFAVPVIICSFFSIGTSVTVTLHVWLTLLPSNAETLIFAVPALTAFTIPFSSTVTTFLLVDSHFTAGSDALAGNTVAVNCRVSATFILREAGLIVIAVTGCTSASSCATNVISFSFA